MKHMYCMDDTDFIAANTITQALNYWSETTCEDPEYYKESLRQLPDNNSLTIRYELDDLEYTFYQIPTESLYEFVSALGAHQVLVTALNSRWAKLAPKPTIICSTEW